MLLSNVGWGQSACRRVTSFGIATAMTSLMLSMPAQGQSAPPQIWFGPMQDHYDPASRQVSWTYHDFPAMLKPNAPWQNAAHAIDAMMFNSTHAAEGFHTDGVPSLPDIKAMLSRNTFKAGGGGATIYTDGVCQGGGVEGMSSDKGFERETYSTVKRWHDEGLPMSYFVMDGPYAYGYDYMQDKCHFSIEDVARRAATTMKMVRDLYPDIVVIDAEGPGKGLPSAWFPGYHRFLEAFHAAYGAPIAYLDMDLHWSDTWHTGYRWVTAAREIADDMHHHGLRVSLIIDAEDLNWDPDVTPPDPSASPRTTMTEEYWMASVRKHIDLVHENALPLDAVDLESWMRFPRNNLPEINPAAWASAVDYAHKVLIDGAHKSK